MAPERTSPELPLDFDFIGALIALGRMDEAVERLERAIEARISYVVFLRHTFAWGDTSATEGHGVYSLRPDPRIDEILAAVGL